MFRISEQIGLCAAYKHIICKSVNLGWKIKLFLCGGMCRNSGHQPFPRPVATVLSCSVADYQSVVFWVAWPSALSPSDGHGVVLFCDWLSVSCLLNVVPISPFPVRWPRCATGDGSIVGVWLFMGWVYLIWTKHATPCSRAVKGWGNQVKAAGAVRLNGKG